MNSRVPEKKKKGKIIQITVSGLLILASLFCITTMTQVLTKGYTSFFGYSMFRVVTNSMEPELPVGALIISRQTGITEIDGGDIICFRSKDPSMLGRIITHRVVAVIEGKSNEINLQTKGDANVSIDADYVTEKNIIGKMVWKSSETNIMAVILSVLTDKFGFFTIIIIPVLLVITLIINNSIRKIRIELDLKKRQLENPDPDYDDEEEEVVQENYQDMYERIKAEMLEEISQGAENETDETTTEEKVEEADKEDN